MRRVCITSPFNASRIDTGEPKESLENSPSKNENSRRYQGNVYLLASQITPLPEKEACVMSGLPILFSEKINVRVYRPSSTHAKKERSAAFSC
jgi:hypothetical protein